MSPDRGTKHKGTKSEQALLASPDTVTIHSESRLPGRSDEQRGQCIMRGGTTQGCREGQLMQSKDTQPSAQQMFLESTGRAVLGKY